MYRGKVVEEGPSRTIFEKPAHPYTAALIEASYLGEVRFGGDTESLEEPREPAPGGCSFEPRCPIATAYCVEVGPELRECRDGQRASCHFPLKAESVVAAAPRKEPSGVAADR